MATIYSLPNETITAITLNLDDASANALARTCKWMNGVFQNTILERFHHNFDTHPQVKKGEADRLIKMYKFRSRMLTIKCDYEDPTEGLAVDIGIRQTKIIAAEMIKILQQAEGWVVDGLVRGKNFEFMEEYTARSTNNIAGEMLRTNQAQNHQHDGYYPGALSKLKVIHTFRLLLAPDLLDLDKWAGTEIFGFDNAQQIAHGTLNMYPTIIFWGQNVEVQIDWLQTALHFFCYHAMNVKRPLTAGFNVELMALPKTQRPRWWMNKLTGEDKFVPLGKKWKITYAYLLQHELAALRSGEQRGFDDNHIDGHYSPAITDMTFNITDGIAKTKQEYDAQVYEWEKKEPEFEEYIGSTRFMERLYAEGGPIKKEGVPYGYPISGTGYDDEDFLTKGWVHPLPRQGKFIDGFQRISFIKYFEKKKGERCEGSRWCFDGVILPGGQIAIGRWWWHDQRALEEGDPFCGPFLMWCIDDLDAPAHDQVKDSAVPVGIPTMSSYHA